MLGGHTHQFLEQPHPGQKIRLLPAAP